jgi:hypothetical protein
MVHKSAEFLGDTSGETLPLYSVPRSATPCEAPTPFKSLMYKMLCGKHAPTCEPLQLWKKLTQNPPIARSWGFAPTPGTNPIHQAIQATYARTLSAPEAELS